MSKHKCVLGQNTAPLDPEKDKWLTEWMDGNKTAGLWLWTRLND